MSSRSPFPHVLRSPAPPAIGCGPPAANTTSSSSGGGEGGAGTGGAGGAGGAGGQGGSGGAPCGAGVNAGAPAAFLSDGLHLMGAAQGFLMAHDAEGFYAFSAICTHSHCNMNK